MRNNRPTSSTTTTTRGRPVIQIPKINLTSSILVFGFFTYIFMKKPSFLSLKINMREKQF